MTTPIEKTSVASQSSASIHAEQARPSRKRPVKERVVLSWSGGKDSTMAAYHLLASRKYEITALLKGQVLKGGIAPNPGLRLIAALSAGMAQ